MYKIRNLKRLLSTFGIVICLFLLIHINLPWMKAFFGLNPRLILNNANRQSAVVKKLMEIKNAQDVNADELFNPLKEVIGVPLRMEDMSYEEIQKSGSAYKIGKILK